MIFRSISRTLVVWVSLSTMLFWAAGAGLAAYVMQDEFSEIFDSAMQETAGRLLPLALDDIRKGDVPDLVGTSDSGDRRDGYLTYQVRDRAGSVLMHSHATPPVPYTAPLAEGFWEGEGMRVFTVKASGKDVFVQVADSLAHRREALTDGMLALSLPFAVLVPISVIVLLFIIRRAVVPLTELRTSIVGKHSGDLSPLSTDGLPEELEPIANSVNIVLGRLSAALVAEREFAANSAHELRTPIAGALAQTQLLMAELGPSPGRERAVLIVQSLQTLARLTEKLLQLARADSGIGSADKSTDLNAVVEMVVTDMQRRAAPEKRIALTHNGGGSVVRKLDPDALAIAVRNLIENALIHGDTGMPVSVHVGDDAIIVSNSARPFDTDELARMRQRFQRGDPEVTGSGLGLSIVDRLVEQMNGSLDIRSRQVRGRSTFEAEIRFN